VNSTSITRFHRHLPHHLHGEASNRRRKRGSSRKNEKRIEGVEIKRREHKEFLFVNCEKRKRKRKAEQRRREREEKKTGRSKEKEKLQCHLLCLFQRQDLQNRREDRKAKTSREKGTKTELNAGDRRKQITKGKELEQTNTDRPASTPSTSLQLLRFSPGLLFNSACISWLHVLLLK
jgi:hypothetical protein